MSNREKQVEWLNLIAKTTLKIRLSSEKKSIAMHIDSSHDQYIRDVMPFFRAQRSVADSVDSHYSGKIQSNSPAVVMRIVTDVLGLLIPNEILREELEESQFEESSDTLANFRAMSNLSDLTGIPFPYLNACQFGSDGSVNDILDIVDYDKSGNISLTFWGDPVVRELIREEIELPDELSRLAALDLDWN